METIESKDNKFINFNMIQVFDSNFTKQQKNDVLNSCLYSQMYANMEYKNMKPVLAWYHFYFNQLKDTCDWITIMPNLEFNGIHSKKDDASIVDWAINSITDSQEENLKFKEVLNELLNLSNSNLAYKILTKNSVKGKYGCFQLVNVFIQDEIVSMKIRAFYYNSKVIINNLIDEIYSPNLVQLYGTEMMATFDEHIYKSIRVDIQNAIEKVRPHNLSSI